MSQVTRHQPWGTRSRPPPGVYTCAISRRCLKNVQSYALSPRRHCFRNHLYCRCAINSIHLHLGLQRFQLQCSIVYYDSVTCCYYTQSGQFSSLLCRHFCDICLISGSKSWPRHCTVFYLCLFYVCCFNLNKWMMIMMMIMTLTDSLNVSQSRIPVQLQQLKHWRAAGGDRRTSRRTNAPWVITPFFPAVMWVG